MTSQAILVSRSYNNSTTPSGNNDSTYEFRNYTSSIGGNDISISTVGQNSGDIGYRHYGHIATKQSADYDQIIDFTITWDIQAEAWEEYSISISPEFDAYVEIYNNIATSSDEAHVNTLNATLKLNGETVSDSLDMSGLQRTTDGANLLNQTSSQTLSELTGNNTISVNYLATLESDSAGGVSWSAVKILWGGNTGSLPTATGIPTDWDNYTSSGGTASADGLF